MKNHIIFTTISMRGGGTERVISILANEYVKKNIAVSILMIADDKVEYELDERIEVVGITGTTGGSLRGRIARIQQMRDFFKKYPESGIISMGTVASMFTIVAGLGLKRDIIISERNDPNRLNHKPIKPIVREIRNILYRKAKSLVLQTEDVKACFPEYILKKSVVISNPLSAELPDYDLSCVREKTVITAGRLTQQKNHKMLIDAFEAFHADYPEYSLKIFGKGEMESELTEYIKEKRMDSFASLCGFSSDLYGELKKGGMYVSSSDWEGISNSLIEALAFGIPTIATDCPVGGSRMCIRNEVNGFLIEPGDVEGLISKMKCIAEGEDVRNMLSLHAVKVREEFAVNRIGKQWLDLF